MTPSGIILSLPANQIREDPSYPCHPCAIASKSSTNPKSEIQSSTGVYLSSIASGVADVDAITLSMAELSREGQTLDLHTAARAIVLAAASNTLVKGGIVLSTGSAALRKVILPGLIATLATAIGVVFIL